MIDSGDPVSPPRKIPEVADQPPADAKESVARIAIFRISGTIPSLPPLLTRPATDGPSSDILHT